MGASMIFASATSTSKDIEDAVREMSAEITSELSEAEIDFATVFYTPHYSRGASLLVHRLREALDPGILIGAMGEGIVGSHREIEREPGITVTAGTLPGVVLKQLTFDPDRWSDVLGDEAAFREAVDASDDTKLFLLVADPFTTPMEPLLDAFNSSFPGVPMIGGMASGARHPKSNCLVLNERILTGGAVAVALGGPIDVDVIVSQGCRPVGRPFRVTGARENVISSLEGEAPLSRIQDIINELSDDDRAILEKGLLVGRAIPRKGDQPLGRGSFLIRGVMGIDRESGAMAVGDLIHEGEVIQFHLRDARTAQEDLELLLSPQTVQDRPRAGLLFLCNGRGTNLFEHPNADVEAIRAILGDVRLSGFFCAGEIGPVGGQNFLHGHTASLALLRPETRT